MRIGDTWGSIRGIVRDHFSFAQIKDLVGAAGLPIHSLAHLQQKSRGGASKGQLMDAIDGLVRARDTEDRDRFVTACIEEILIRNQRVQDELERVLGRIGWGISSNKPYPLRLQIDLETANLDGQIKEGISKCLQRYRDGDFDGAITSICGVVDHLTEEIYNMVSLGNHRDDSYQQRVSRSFNALETSFRRPLLLSGLSSEEANRLWHNHRGAINQAGYVLGSFRREYSDVHGAQKPPPELVQRAIDCAVFIVRGIAALK